MFKTQKIMATITAAIKSSRIKCADVCLSNGFTGFGLAKNMMLNANPHRSDQTILPVN